MSEVPCSQSASEPTTTTTECKRWIDHCWHTVRKEKREFNTADEHGSFNPEKPRKYKLNGEVMQCCRCGKTDWFRDAARFY